MLELEQVGKTYGSTVALAPTTLTFEPGKTTVLLGPSGCGKSTLLRILVGLVRPDGGTLRFNGEVVNDGNLREVRRRMGYVIQDGGLFPHLTNRQNVVLMAKYLGWEREKIEQRLGDLTRLTHLPPASLDRYPQQVSGGQRQRVSMMRALMLDPDLLLFDEPMGALDPLIRAELQTELRNIFQTLNKTVVVVTHDLAEAGFLGDTIVLLKEGRIVQQGTLADLAHRPADPFVSQFLGAQRSPLESIEGAAS